MTALVAPYPNVTGGGGGTLGTVVVTVGTDGTYEPKSGIGSEQWGYVNSANSISGGTVGSRSPTTLLGATINAIYFSDDFSTPGTIKLILNGDQTAQTVSSVTIDGETYNFGAPSFAGGQTTWSASALSLGNQWGVGNGVPADAVFS